MTVEELLSLVNKEVDTTKFKSLSQKTITEELNDVLDEMGDDAATNAKKVTKLATRLKRMDGNLHKCVSDEIKKSREEAERKKKEEEERREKTGGEEKPEGSSSSSDDKYDKLLAKLEALERANAERDKKASRAATEQAVRKGLKDKFDRAKLELNDFFLDAAMSKLTIPDTDADVLELITQAEGIYTTDYKRATGNSAIPRKGSSNTPTGDRGIRADEWDDIKSAKSKEK